MSGFPLRRQTRKSLLISGPPRLRFSPRLCPLHLPCSIIRSRKNRMFAFRRSRLTPAARYDGYLDSMQSGMSVTSELLHAPGFPAPPPSSPSPPGGGGGGSMTGGFGVLKMYVDDQLLKSDPSAVCHART